MATIDLAERRRQRSKKPHKVVLNGHSWELPAELPVMVAEWVAHGEFGRVLATLFGDKAAEVEGVFTLNDLAEIVNVYGVELGESRASSAS